MLDLVLPVEKLDEIIDQYREDGRPVPWTLDALVDWTFQRRLLGGTSSEEFERARYHTMIDDTLRLARFPGKEEVPRYLRATRKRSNPATGEREDVVEWDRLETASREHCVYAFAQVTADLHWKDRIRRILGEALDSLERQLDANITKNLKAGS